MVVKKRGKSSSRTRKGKKVASSKKKVIRKKVATKRKGVSKRKIVKKGKRVVRKNSGRRKAKSKIDSRCILSCKGLSKQYGKNKVLQDLSFDLKSGEVFGVIGMSGSGKTTLLNIIIGFLGADAGEVLFRVDKGMMSLSKSTSVVKHLFGFAPQDPSFYPKLTTKENLEYFATMYDMSSGKIKEYANELLRLVNLSNFKNHLAKELSFGMQKRLGIACALVHKPRLLILDEPTADLDPIMRRETWELLSKVNKNGTTIVIASHLLDELEGECDRIAVLHKGKITKLGTIDHLKKMYTTNNEVILMTASKNYSKIISKLKAKRSLKISNVSKRDNTLVLQTSKAEELIKHLVTIVQRSKDSIVKLSVARPSLEQVFIKAHKK